MSASAPSTTAVFRISPLALLGVVSLAVCVTPTAFGAPWLWLVYLVPLGLAVWVLRVRTTAGPEQVAARGVLRTRRVPWDDVSALRLRSSRSTSRVSAMLRDGSELSLPAVRVRDLPVLAAVSGGRLPDPSAAPEPGADPDVDSDVDADPAPEHGQAPSRTVTTPESTSPAPSPAPTSPAPTVETPTTASSEE